VFPTAASAPLRWDSPNQVTSGVPVTVSSITSCPPPPTPGDTVLVEISLAFPSGGTSSEILTANADGSWSGAVNFHFSGVSGKATFFADCQDFIGVTGVVYAQYQTHHAKIFSS
jgi:hypothetical protein